VQSIPAYALWRFLAGLGLAGELGAAITLVSEVLPRESRGYGTALVSGVGVLGTVTAALVGKYIPWREAYLLGGILGMVLLFLRIGIRESLLYTNLSHEGIKRGDFFSLFTSRERLFRYIRCILIGLPMWFEIGILVIFVPEFAPLLGVSGRVDPAIALACCYSCLAAGSLLSGSLSQLWRTRTKVVGLFMFIGFAGMVIFLLGRGFTPLMMYVVVSWLGLATGYWAVFVTVAAEQFGTNLRATVATTVPNFVRGAVVLITNSFLLIKIHWGMLAGAWIVGLVCYALGFASLRGLKDTHGRDLDFVE
jgi:MFS family permease